MQKTNKRKMENLERNKRKMEHKMFSRVKLYIKGKIMLLKYFYVSYCVLFDWDCRKIFFIELDFVVGS